MKIMFIGFKISSCLHILRHFGFQAVGHDLSKYPKINEWMAKTKAAVPDYQTANQLGLNHWKEMFEEIKKRLS